MNKPYQEISLLEFQKKYQREEDCEMLHKIRHAMKNCDTAYQLAGIVEIDDSFFGSSITGRSKRGRGTSKTAVIVEASPHGDAIGFAKMTVVDKGDSTTIGHLIKTDMREDQSVKTDGLPVYTIVSKRGHNHIQEIVKGKKAHEVLKWNHMLISNAKSFIIGTFHRFGKKHLQAYLDEFCYRFNRRKWELQLFDRLATVCVNSHAFGFAALTQ